MVTFRFYVVSTVAFFLALAAGVVLGSALDQTIVDSLHSSLDRVEGNLDDTVAAMDARKKEIDDLNAYVEQSAPAMLTNQLTGTSTLVVAEPGASEDVVIDLVKRLRTAGSGVPGVVWMDPKWNLTNDADRKALAEASKTTVEASGKAQRKSTWTAVVGQLSALSATGAGSQAGVPGSPSETTTTVVNQPLGVLDLEVLTSLENAGFVRLERVEQSSGQDAVGGVVPLVAVVTAPESQLSDPGVAANELAVTVQSASIPAVVSEAYTPGDRKRERGTTLTQVRAGSPTGISTVDNLDLTAGRVATALAFADLRRGKAGNFGFGPDVDQVVPEWHAS